MSPSFEQIREAALALPLEERLQLFDTLTATLHPPEDPGDLSPAFIAELKRRSAEMDEDPTSCVAWEEVRAEMEKPVAA
jgi:putative addiction module component (TIGR02574 family)